MVDVRQYPGSRFNVLLTEDRRQAPEHWTQQLSRLLEPQGVESFLARTGREAVDLVGSVRIHAALIDMATPTGDPLLGQATMSGRDYPGGLWLLEVIRRMPNRPPVVVVNSMVAPRVQAQRLLNDALRLGAFSVVNRPVDLDDLLAVIRRLIDRQYRGCWPDPPNPPSVDPPDPPTDAGGRSPDF